MQSNWQDCFFYVGGGGGPLSIQVIKKGNFVNGKSGMFPSFYFKFLVPWDLYKLSGIYIPRDFKTPSSLVDNVH
jgi:hypothetical protein